MKKPVFIVMISGTLFGNACNQQHYKKSDSGSSSTGPMQETIDTQKNSSLEHPDTAKTDNTKVGTK